MLEPLELLGCPVWGASVTLRCRWQAEPELARLAGSEPLRLATRVRAAAGSLVVPEGPRSRPFEAGAAGGDLLVPIVVPPAPGVYEVEVDSVLEGHWWGSWRGIPPACLRIERRSRGELAWSGAAGAPTQVLGIDGPAATRRFRIPHRLYGAGETERCVEIPWVLSRYAGERHVLDVGYAHAEPRYLDALTALEIPVLVGMDLVAAPRVGVRAVVGDARTPPLRPAGVDLILAVSVIEHIGRDNRRYVGDRPDPSGADGDLCAVRALSELLAPGGRMLLTVPFGAVEDHGWFVQYDARRLGALIRASGLGLGEIEVFSLEADGWRGPVPLREVAGRRYGAGAPAATAVACLTLRRPRRPGFSMGQRLRLWQAGLGARSRRRARIGA